MNSNEILKKAMAELRAIVDKYEVGAAIIIHRPGQYDYLFNIDPPYSGIKFRDDISGAVEFKFASKHYNGDKNKAHKVANDTVNMIDCIMDQSARFFMITQDLMQQLEKALPIQRKAPVDLSERPKSFSFEAVSKIHLSHTEGSKVSDAETTDLTLNVSDNLDKRHYFDEDGLPAAGAVKPLTIALISGLIANVRNAAKQGWWKEGEHMEYIFKQLQEMHVHTGIEVKEHPKK